MEFYVDKENRRVIIQRDIVPLSLDSNIIKEFDKVKKIFIPNTVDTYLCELVLLDIEDEDGNMETKAFARRVGYPEWLLEFNVTDFEV